MIKTLTMADKSLVAKGALPPPTSTPNSHSQALAVESTNSSTVSPTSSTAPSKAATRLVSKDVRFNAPQSPGSDEGFGSLNFPSMSLSSNFLSSPSPSSPSSPSTPAVSSPAGSAPVSFATTKSPNPTWKGNFRSSYPVEPVASTCIDRKRRDRSRKTPTVTIFSNPKTNSDPASTLSTLPGSPGLSSLPHFQNSCLLPHQTDSGVKEADSLLTDLIKENSVIELIEDVEQEEEAEDEEKTLIDYYQVDDDRVTPLHVAALTNDVDATFYLISKAESPAQLDMHNKFGSSPVHLAAKVGNSVSLRDLILGGANAVERNAKGETALHIACRNGHNDCVLSLTTPFSMEDPVITTYEPPYQRLPHNLDIVSYDGLTPFHLACFYRHKKIIVSLARLGADVDAQDARSGRTPLHFAVERKDDEIVRLLLETCKADVDAETFDGATSLCLAEGRGFQSLSRVLRSYGANPNKGINAWRHKEESDYGSDFDSRENSFSSL